MDNFGRRNILIGISLGALVSIPLYFGLKSCEPEIVESRKSTEPCIVTFLDGMPIYSICNKDKKDYPKHDYRNSYYKQSTK